MAKKKRRVVVVAGIYTDPLVYRNILSLITPHCTVEAFARLKRVCKAFLKWLPEHHPLRDEIIKEYAKVHPRERPEIVDVLLRAYFRRLLGMIHPGLHNRVVTRRFSRDGTCLDGYIRLSLETGVLYIREGAISHVFADRPCATLEFKGNMEVDCKGFVSGGFQVFKWNRNPGLERLVLPHADDTNFLSTYLMNKGLLK